MASKPQLDSRIEIITPENIAFQYRVAGPFRRMPAYLIDVGFQTLFLVLAAYVIVLALELIRMPGAGLGVWLLLWFCVSWFYGGLFEAFWNGQTPGKRIMKIRVLTTSGQPINALQAVLRNVLRFVDSAPVIPVPGVGGMPLIPLFQIGLLTTLINDRYQRLGDLACGTMVVIEEGRWMTGLTRVDNPKVLALAADLPPTFQASRSLGRALAHYVDRRTRFVTARQNELAKRLSEPLRLRLNLSADTNPDLLLCAVYYKTFVAPGVGEKPRRLIQQNSGRPQDQNGSKELPPLDLEEMLRS